MMNSISIGVILNCGTMLMMTTGHVHGETMVPTQYVAGKIIPAQSYLCNADTAVFPFPSAVIGQHGLTS